LAVEGSFAKSETKKAISNKSIFKISPYRLYK